MNELSSIPATLEQNPSQDLKSLSILRERARTLAKPSEEAKAADDSLELVEFRLSNEIYGIDAKFVKEVHLFNNLRKIPGTPDFMPGVINLNGKIISMIDLKKIIGLAPSADNSHKQSCLVLAHKESMLAMLIDEIIGIKSETPAEISSAFTTDKNSQDNYISAISSSNTIILDAQRILNDPKLTVNIL